MWFVIIMMLISYFTSKKSGASSTKSAMIAAGAGAGAYYVGTQTEWGQDLVQSVEDWFTPTNKDGTPVTDANGNQIYLPAGSSVQYDASGNVVRNADGSILTTTVKTVGDVLSSWGGAGTAAVVGTTALATSGSDTRKYLLWGGLALAAIFILK